jgi:transcriptional regulator with XRE-family HTH domain
MAGPQNIIGDQVRALRRAGNLTQAMLAARCGTLGWDIGENTITKIETRIRCVTDAELVCMATALNVSPLQLIPTSNTSPAAIRHFFLRGGG